MTWTYGGNPGTSTPEQRRDAVRHLVGDVETTDQQVSDEGIAFALSEAGDDVYRASASICYSIAAKYSRLVDTDVDSGGMKASYSQRREAYTALATRLEKQAKKFGKTGLGVPRVGGISRGVMEQIDSDEDRFGSVFTVDELLRTKGDDDYT